MADTVKSKFTVEDDEKKPSQFEVGDEESAKPALKQGDFQTKKGGPIKNANAMGINTGTTGNATPTSVAREGILGLSSGFTGMPESLHPISDFGKQLVEQGKEASEHPLKTIGTAMLGPAPQLYQMGKGILESGVEMGKGLYHINPEEVAHGGGQMIGRIAQAGLLKEAPEAAEKPSTVGTALAPVKPHLESIADAAIHPMQIPGKLLKAAVEKIPTKPEFPGASLPSADEFYANEGAERNTIRERTEQMAKEKAKLQPIPTDMPTPINPGGALPSAEDFYQNRGEEINTIRERSEALDKQRARAAEANKPAPELGSPENPGFHSPLPTSMPKRLPELGSPENPGFHSKLPTRMPEVTPPTPELGSPENPGWHSEIPNRMPKTLPNVAAEPGPPAQLPAGGSAQKLPTLFQKEGKPQIMKFPDLINQAAGVKPLRPDVPLKEQLTNQPPAPLEEVDPVKAKYPDPAVRQMVRANGERFYEAAKGDPALVKAGHDLTRVDLRQAGVNLGIDMGQKTVSDSKFAGEGSIPREEMWNQLLDKEPNVQKIIDAAKKTEGTANDRPQVKYKGGINEKGVEASTRAISPEEEIRSLAREIANDNETLRNSTRPDQEKAQVRERINQNQERLDELRGAKK